MTDSSQQTAGSTQPSRSKTAWLAKAGRRASLAVSKLRTPLAVDIEFRAPLPEGPVIWASHHATMLDGVRLLQSIGREAVLADPSQSNIVARLRRKTPTAVEQERKLLASLASGIDVIVFPEGAVTSQELVLRGHPEIARLAFSAGVPVVPVALTADGLVAGASLDASRYAAVHPESELLETALLRGFTDEIMTQIVALSGASYRDIYLDELRSEQEAYGEAAGVEAELRYRELAKEAEEAERRAMEAEEHEQEELEAAAAAARRQAQEASAREEMIRRVRRERGSL